MRVILKRSISTLKFEPLKKIASMGTDLMEKLVTTTPFIPTAHGKLSLHNIQDLYNSATSTNSGFLGAQIEKMNKESSAAMDAIFGIDRSNLNINNKQKVLNWIANNNSPTLQQNFVSQLQQNSFFTPGTDKLAVLEPIFDAYFKKLNPTITDWKSVLGNQKYPEYSTVTSTLKKL